MKSTVQIKASNLRPWRPSDGDRHYNVFVNGEFIGPEPFLTARDNPVVLATFDVEHSSILEALIEGVYQHRRGRTKL